MHASIYSSYISIEGKGHFTTHCRIMMESRLLDVSVIDTDILVSRVMIIQS